MPDERLFESYKDFVRFRNELINRYSFYKIRDDICEDIFQDAIIIVLRKYDESKGSFRAFIAAVYINKLKDHLARDKYRKFIALSVESTDLDSIPDSIPDEIEVPGGFATIEDFLKRLQGKLTEEEKNFLNTLKSVLPDCKLHGIVTEVSEKLNKEPNEGWNIWRRIRTKARRVVAEDSDFIALEEPTATYDAETLKAKTEDKPSKILFYSTVPPEVIKNDFPLLSFLNSSQQKEFLKLFTEKN